MKGCFRRQSTRNEILFVFRGPVYNSSVSFGLVIRVDAQLVDEDVLCRDVYPTEQDLILRGGYTFVTQILYRFVIESRCTVEGSSPGLVWEKCRMFYCPVRRPVIAREKYVSRKTLFRPYGTQP